LKIPRPYGPDGGVPGAGLDYLVRCRRCQSAFPSIGPLQESGLSVTGTVFSEDDAAGNLDHWPALAPFMNLSIPLVRGGDLAGFLEGILFLLSGMAFSIGQKVLKDFGEVNSGREPSRRL